MTPEIEKLVERLYEEWRTGYGLSRSAKALLKEAADAIACLLEEHEAALAAVRDADEHWPESDYRRDPVRMWRKQYATIIALAQRQEGEKEHE